MYSEMETKAKYYGIITTFRTGIEAFNWLKMENIDTGWLTITAIEFFQY